MLILAANQAALMLALLGKNRMLIGEYTHTIDTKKRLAIPARLRKDLGKRAVITRGLDNCLFVFPSKQWQTLVQKLGKLPLGQSSARGFIRLMLGGAMDVELDGLGRILIPDYLKKYASLKKNVVIAGLYNRIEIWDETKWNSYKVKMEREIGDMAERLGELGV